jgi:phage recombination protein Bet
MTLTTQPIFNDDFEKTLRETYCNGLTDSEFEIYKHVLKRTGLDPFRNQIYALKRKDKNLGQKMTIQTGIDGFRLIAERTEKYAPGREPTYAYDAQGKIVSATAYIKKLVAGTWHEVSATAFWNEYVQKSFDGKPTTFWLKMPHGQLAKCAEALALRKAFPSDFSGIYSTEEMAQADNGIIEAEVSKSVEIKASNEVEKVLSEEDISQEIVDIYIDKNWRETKDSFIIFMKEMLVSKGWNNKQCLEMYKKHPERIKEVFAEWEMNRCGL